MVSQSVWSTDPRLWPKAPREYVFIAAAFDEVGCSLFGEEWTGREALPAETPIANSLRRVTTAPRPHSSMSQLSVTLPKWTPQEMEEKKRTLDERVEAERLAAELVYERRLHVAAWIADKARNAELVTFGMPTYEGAALEPLPPSIWNRADDWELFASCQVKTIVAPVALYRKFFIFLTRESLTRTLSPRVGTAKAEKDAERWLRMEFRDPTTSSLSKKEFQQNARERFGGLSGEGFDRAWAAATADFPERAKSGRKPRST